MSRKIRSCSSQLPDRLTMILFLGAYLLAALSGCGAGGEAESRAIRIGVALYAQDDTFISTIMQDFQWITQEAERDGEWKINLSIADGGRNQTAQMEQIDRFISRGYDVLCVNIVDRTAAAVVADKAEEAGIPLIFFNRQPVKEDLQRWEKIYYVGARAEEGGTLQGRLVLDAWRKRREKLDRNGDGALQYAVLEGEPGHQDTLLRTEYSIQALAEAGIEIEKVAGDTANWSRGEAVAKVRQWLEKVEKGIEVIFSNNDDMALGAIDAFQEAGLPLPLIVGVDATAPALEAVKEGTLYGTVLNDAEGIAGEMMELALTLARNEAPAEDLKIEEEHYIWLPCRQITQENLSDFLPVGSPSAPGRE